VTELFVYGTLRDAEYQEALFGRALSTRPATLPDWRAVVAEGGYLTVVPEPADAVNGDLIALDDAALATADAWEEVPLYARVPVEVRTAGDITVSAQVYVRATAARERAPEGLLAQHDRREVLEHIREFRLRRALHERTNSESA
jgi:gamma-glutamylcyclotransferase (GGCT)/AIG2-like uncharacterized protein YtfP